MLTMTEALYSAEQLKHAPNYEGGEPETVGCFGCSHAIIERRPGGFLLTTTGAKYCQASQANRSRDGESTRDEQRQAMYDEVEKLLPMRLGNVQEVTRQRFLLKKLIETSYAMGYEDGAWTAHGG